MNKKQEFKSLMERVKLQFDTVYSSPNCLDVVDSYRMYDELCEEIFTGFYTERRSEGWFRALILHAMNLTKYLEDSFERLDEKIIISSEDNVVNINDFRKSKHH